MQREVETTQMATEEQVRQIKSLIEETHLPAETSEKWLKKAGVDCFEDMPEEAIGKCIVYLEARKNTP